MAPRLTRVPGGYPDAVLLVTDIDDSALAAARRRLGTTTADETVNAALRLVAGLPSAGSGVPDEVPTACGSGDPDRHVVRLAEDILDQQADGDR